MRGMKISVTLAVLVAISAVGCKSMPSLTWWKTASKNESADSTAVAHSAPALPSEVALQTESPVITKTPATAAAPYVSTGAPGVSPSGYPTTSAPPFKPAASPTQVAAAPAAPTTPTASSSSLSSSSTAMPYNPNSVPPPAQSVASVAAPKPSADRYGSVAGLSSAPATSNAAPTYPATTSVAAPVPSSMATAPPATVSSPMSTTAGNTSLGNRYGNATAATTVPPKTRDLAKSASASSDSFAIGTIPAAPTATPTQTTSGGLGSRYVQNTAPGIPAASNAPSAVPGMANAQSPVTQTAATGGTYRPGGTSSYPNSMPSQPAFEIASRPEDSASSSKDNSVPNVATPGSTQPGQRYW